MARTVRDAAILLSAMVGADPQDPFPARKLVIDFTRFLSPAGLKGARIGVPRQKFYGYNRATDKVAQQALDVMKSHGAVLIDPADLPNAGKYDDSEMDVLLYEFKEDLRRYLATRGPDCPVKSLKDIIAFNGSSIEKEMPFFAQELLEMSLKKGPLTTKAYRQALEKNHRLTREEGIDAVMDKHRLDALVAPTQGPPWLIDLINGDAGTGGSATQPAAVAGYPHITVPMGYVHGLPVGLSFFGRAFSEPTLFKLAYAFEQAAKVRKPPTFTPTADLGI
jgi:amidase